VDESACGKEYGVCACVRVCARARVCVRARVRANVSHRRDRDPVVRHFHNS